MKKYHEVQQATVSQGVLSAVVDGKPVSANLRALSPVLETATDDDLEFFEISPSGYGIHWPRVDEDISIDGLLGVSHKPLVLRQSA